MERVKKGNLSSKEIGISIGKNLDLGIQQAYNTA